MGTLPPVTNINNASQSCCQVSIEAAAQKVISNDQNFIQCQQITWCHVKSYIGACVCIYSINLRGSFREEKPHCEYDLYNIAYMYNVNTPETWFTYCNMMQYNHSHI